MPTKAPKEKLSLRDSVDLYGWLNQYIDDHIDEIELNGGALPDDLAKLCDEIDAAMADRVDALAFKIDEFVGNAASAKATEDRAARRRRVYENTIKSLKAYATFQTQRAGGRIEGKTAVFRMQKNGGVASVELMAPPDAHQDLMLGIFDAERVRLLDLTDIPVPGEAPERQHALAPYITVQRVAMLDKKALAAAYEARREQLEQDLPLLRENDILWPDGVRPRGATPGQIEAVLIDMRARCLADNLATEFPGVRVERGVHLRID